MKFFVLIAVGVIFCLLFGFLGYILTISIVPEKFKSKLFSIIPFFPRIKYSIILYFISGILYSLIVYFVGVTGQSLKFIIVILSVIISSQLVKFIAKIKKESLEESYEEEMKRKRNS